jgi:hypothetical protein
MIDAYKKERFKGRIVKIKTKRFLNEVAAI